MRLLLLIAVMLMLATPSWAEDHICAKVVADRMTELGVSREQIKRVVFVDVTDNDRFGRVVGYEAWVDLKHCLGSVVNRLSRQCEIEESYTRGACRIKGLKNF